MLGLGFRGLGFRVEGDPEVREMFCDGQSGAAAVQIANIP